MCFTWEHVEIVKSVTDTNENASGNGFDLINPVPACRFFEMWRPVRRTKNAIQLYLTLIAFLACFLFWNYSSCFHFSFTPSTFLFTFIQGSRKIVLLSPTCEILSERHIFWCSLLWSSKFTQGAFNLFLKAFHLLYSHTEVVWPFFLIIFFNL